MKIDNLGINPDPDTRAAGSNAKQSPRWLRGEIRNRLPGSLQVKISLLIIIPVIFILIFTTTIEYDRHRDRHLNIMSDLAAQTGQVIKLALDRDMLVSDFDAIQTTINRISSNDRITSLLILDLDGNVVFAPSDYADSANLQYSDPSCQACHKLPVSERPSGIVVENANGKSVFRSMHPIKNRKECAACHKEGDPLIGLLLIDQAIEPIEGNLSIALRNNLVLWTGAVLTTALLANLAIYQFIVRRLSRLAFAMEDLGSGELDRPLSDPSNDVIGRLSAVFNRMVLRVRKREKENKDLTKALDTRITERGVLLKRVIHAQEEERKRLAREMHDDLGQGLSSIALNIELTQRALDGNARAAQEHLQRAGAMVSDSTERMYDLILGLRPSALDDLGLVAALNTLIQQTLEPLGIDSDFQTKPLPERLPPEIETILFRIIQEALTNVVRHSQASKVFLSLAPKNGAIEGKIEDNGIGFDPSRFKVTAGDERGLGLLGMKERVELFGGKISIHSELGAGTRIKLILPIEGGSDV